MILDGKKIADGMLAEVKEAAALRRTQGESFRLAAVLVGPSTDSGQAASKFLELKKKVAEKVGIDFRLYEFPVDITTQKLRKEVVGIAKAEVNQAVIIELPLPEHINTQYVLNAIPPDKDPDVLSEKSQGAFFSGRSSVLPPAVEAVKMILKKNDLELKGKNCAIFGYGLLVGRPVSHWLAQRGAAVSIINEYTPNPEFFALNADVVISGVGKPNLIKSDMIKSGAVVIDFGYGNLNGQIAGDVDFGGASGKASLITPVPGGVGPIVIAAVFKNMMTLLK